MDMENNYLGAPEQKQKAEEDNAAPMLTKQDSGSAPSLMNETAASVLGKPGSNA